MTTPAPTPGQTSISSSAGPATSTGPPQASGPSAPADRASHLSLILDLSPIQWALSSADPISPLSLSTFLAHLFAFLNAHLAAKAENSLSVFGALPGRSVMLYSSSPASSSSTGSRLRVSSEATHGVDVPPPDANSYQPFKVVNSSVSSRIASELSSLTDFEEEQPPALVGALAKALCYIHRIQSTSVTDDPAAAAEPRILVLSVSPDASTAYVPVMNAIFSAQKLRVPIDVCQLFGPPTTFLQQAAHLTTGAYLHLTDRSSVLQYLIMSFLPAPSLRTILAVPTQTSVDLRASCFCHRRVVDVGCVCSVCLSIFCQPVPVCTTCRTKFPMKTLQRLKASQPPSSISTSTSGSAPSSAPGTPRATATRPTSVSGSLARSGSGVGGSSLPSSNGIGAHANGQNGVKR